MKDDKASRVLNALGATFIMLPLGVLWYGWIIHVRWNWFIVPLWLPAVSWALACGVRTVVVAFIGPGELIRDDLRESKTERYVTFFLYGGLTLIVGWVIKHFL